MVVGQFARRSDIKRTDVWCFNLKSKDFLSVCLSHLVAECLPDILKRFETLLQLSSTRRTALEDQLCLYVFEREAKELQTWLTSKKTVAESKDCGQDLEDVEVSHYDVGCPVIATTYFL